MNWWAVYCAANKEALANLWLQRRGFVTYFPHERLKPHWKRVPGSKTHSELVSVKAQLPRYLFVETDAQKLSEVNKTMGVATVVYAPGGTPFPIEAKAIDTLKKHLSDEGGFRNPVPDKGFTGRIGDLVKGKEGWPHWGLFAHVMRICGESVAVQMLMFGSPAREVIVPGASIEAYDAEVG